MRRLLNYLRRAVRALALLLVAVYGMLYILLSIDAVQQRVCSEAERALRAKLGVPLEIGRVGIRPFNKLSLEEVYLPDQAGDTLFFANKIAVGVSWLPFIKKDISLTTVQLIGFKAQLRREAAGEPLNAQFVVDAFASHDTVRHDFPFDLRINTIFLRRGSVSYDVASEPRLADRFDKHHIALANLSGALSLRALTADSLNVHLKRLALTEQSGLRIDRLAFDLTANRSSAQVEEFQLQMPHTDLRFDSLSVDYGGIALRQSLADSARFHAVVSESTVGLTDISAFAPGLRHFESPLMLTLEASGPLNRIELPRLSLFVNHEIELETQATLINITRPAEAYLTGRVSRLDLTPTGLMTIINNFSPDTHPMPTLLERLGTVGFRGDIEGRLADLVAHGQLHSRIGDILTDVRLGKDFAERRFTLEGNVVSTGLNTGELFDGSDLLNHLAFALSVDLTKQSGLPLSGKIEGEISDFDFRGYDYANLRLNGSFAGRSCDGLLTLDDPNGHVSVSGRVDLSRPGDALFNLTADLRDVRPANLKLYTKYPDLALSLRLDANMQGGRFDSAQGTLAIDSLTIGNAGERFVLDRLTVDADGRQSPQSITIQSPLLQAHISGRYDFRTLPAELIAMLGREALPVVLPTDRSGKSLAPTASARNCFDFDLRIANLSELTRVVPLPFSLESDAAIAGRFDSEHGVLRLNGQLPDYSIGKNRFSDGILLADIADARRATLRFSTMRLAADGSPLALTLNAEAADALLNARFNWSNLKSVTYCGSLEADVRFTRRQRSKHPVRTDIDILPTSLIIGDSIWALQPATVVVDSGRIAVDNFRVGHDAQQLLIDGVISKLPTDTMLLSLRDISLDYIFETLGKEYIRFGGNGTGDFFVSSDEGLPVIRTDSFKVKDFTYNKVHLGDLNVRSDWDAKHNGIGIHGAIARADARPTLVDGGVYLAQDSLWLNFKADRLPVDFVDLWTSKIMKQMHGRASGDLTLYGRFKELNLTGDAYADNVSFGIEYLNTTYTVCDSVRFRTDGITFDHISVFDRNRNEAFADGRVSYRNFKDITYDISLRIPDGRPFLAFNVTEKLNPVYWGTVYASGTAHIYGDVEKTWIDVAARSSANSRFTFSLDDNLTAGDYTFINFRDADKLYRHEAEADEASGEATAARPLAIAEPVDKEHEIYLNMQMEATPDVTIAIIMDSSTGDQIKGNGSGNIRLEYSTATDFRLYGSYTIDKGSYFFNLQDVIMRDFTINQGSRINFRGDPLSAELDMQATYQVTANLTELDESFAQSRELSRPTVPVQCILNIQGALRRPDLSFDINLPTVSDDVDRQVKNLIATDEMMNRQILYLMILNKFYTPDYANSQNRYNELSSVASSTLSSQLNNLLGQISDNWNIGTNIRSDKGDFSDVEVELALSSQLLNNRLLFNGNLGYRDNPNANNSFIGDFDLEYLLTPAGSWRLKAYNHYNDRNYSVKSALTTQGVGILFKKDFTTFDALFREFLRKKRRESQSD